MKKRFLPIVTAVLFALGCVMGLVACNKSGGSEVTKSEWTSAIKSAEENRSYTFTVRKGDVTYAYDADAKHERYRITETNGEESTQTIYAKEGEAYYVYTEAGAAEGAALFAAAETSWVKTAITEEEFNDATAECRTMIAIMTAAEERFDSFTYNAEEKKYTAENITLESVGTADKITATFEDGVLVSFDVQGFTAADSGEKTDYSYGGAASSEVVVPEVEEENDGKNTVTAEQWAQAMDLKAVDNFTCKITHLDNGVVEVFFKYDGLKRYMYHRGFLNGKYEEVADKSEFEYVDPSGALDMYITAQMDEFTYDEEKRCYVADHAITLSAGGETFLYDPGIFYMEIYFENGKLVRIIETEKYIEEEDSPEYTTQIDIYDYGTTEVTFPS